MFLAKEKKIPPLNVSVETESELKIDNVESDTVDITWVVSIGWEETSYLTWTTYNILYHIIISNCVNSVPMVGVEPK